MQLPTSQQDLCTWLSVCLSGWLTDCRHVPAYLLLLHVVLNRQDHRVRAGMEGVPADGLDTVPKGDCGRQCAAMGHFLQATTAVSEC